MLPWRHEAITCLVMTHPIPRASDLSPKEMAWLERSISAPRLGRYILACQGDTKTALGLYQWNLEVSAAFFVPLQMLEVTIRNAISEAIQAAYGSSWTHNQGFISSLKILKKGFSPRLHLTQIAAEFGSSDKAIAELKFIFWQKMFVAGLDATVWNPHLRAVFPNLGDGTIQQIRGRIHDDLEVLRTLRNRIAHHEPIFERDLHHDLHLIDMLIGYRCQHTVNWMRRIEQVSALLARHPLVPAMPQARPA